MSANHIAEQQMKVDEEVTCRELAACPPLRLMAIAGVALGLGIVSNGFLNASTADNYVGRVQVEKAVVRAPVEGILQAWHVAEGETIDPQVLLCEIGGHNLARQIQLKRQEVERLEARMATLSAEVDVKLNEHLRSLGSDIYQAELQTAELLQKKYFYELEAIAWRDRLNSYEETHTGLAPNGSVTKQAAISSGEAEPELTDRQIQALLKEESSINSLEATNAQLDLCAKRLAKLKEQKREVEKRVQVAVGLSEVELQLSQAKDELASLQKHLEQQNVRSGSLGTVANLRRRPGEYVQAGEVLADMYQLHNSYLMVDVPSTRSHRFQVDSPVKCQFPNGEIRTGVVTQIALATTSEKTGEKSANPTVPLKIEPTGALWPKMPVGGQVTIIR